MTAMERMDALFIAAINGHCLGGGLQLALVCDYRLASADARLGLPAVKERLIPSMSLYRLPRLIGLARAQELIRLGEPIDARHAKRIGLVNRVVAPGEFEAELARTIARVLALPATTVAASKRLTRQAFDAGFHQVRRRALHDRRGPGAARQGARRERRLSEAREDLRRGHARAVRVSRRAHRHVRRARGRWPRAAGVRAYSTRRAERLRRARRSRDDRLHLGHDGRPEGRRPPPRPTRRRRRQHARPLSAAGPG